MGKGALKNRRLRRIWRVCKLLVLKTAVPLGIILSRKRNKQAFIKVESQPRYKRKRPRFLYTVFFFFQISHIGSVGYVGCAFTRITLAVINSIPCSSIKPLSNGAVLITKSQMKCMMHYCSLINLCAGTHI